MNLDYTTLELQRRQHPAWRLLAADSAPLVASFLHRVFVVPNVRVMAQSNLVEALEDTLYGLCEQLGSKAFPKSAQEYLNDWAANDKGWLRKFYPVGSDEPHFDLTPTTERALAWLGSLSDRSFVGTESRLLTLFGLLKQMSDGSETNPQARMAELHKQREAIDAEIARVVEGNIALLDDTALKDRFQQFTGLARELLADFREVENNFRALDRAVRERIALWDGGKGELLQEIMGERDAIAESDQGKSFRAFWDFLMSQSRQEEFTALLARVLDLPPVSALAPNVRPAHRGPAFAAVAPLSGRQGLAGKPPHHGHIARYRRQGHRPARCGAGGPAHAGFHADRHHGRRCGPGAGAPAVPAARADCAGQRGTAGG
jgi:hypothetical protein